MRIGNLRGVDMTLFDFDYDLPWYAFFLTADGAVLGRFGGRDADTPGKYQTLGGLRQSLVDALVRFRANKLEKPPARKPIRAEDYPAAARLADNACIHCHHVHEFRREALQRDKRWSLDDVWMYPQPENLGLTLDAERGSRVVSVQPKSAAASVGMKANDVLLLVQGMPISSVADVQFALHQAPKKGAVSVAWRSGADTKTGTAMLAENWRKTDVSWRWSLKSMSPNPSIIGDDLGPDERKKLNLEPRQLAYRQMNFLTPTARHAGLLANDVIVGIDDQPLAMTARQFETYIRLHYQVGQEVTLNVLRGKERVKVKLKLPE
ncbi:MAG: PDZ domain-containing protein [Gemmataceae bacterium]|nr:PDZ domain-containing protein [Gemmataceae bacterium]